MTGFNLSLGGGGGVYRGGDALVGPWKLGDFFFLKKMQGRARKKFRKRKCHVRVEQRKREGNLFYLGVKTIQSEFPGKNNQWCQILQKSQVR